MDFIIWLLPIFVVTILIPLLGKKQKKWSDLTRREKTLLVSLLIIGCVMFLLGAVFAFVY